MPFIPNLLERFFLLHLNKGPGPLLDIIEGSALRLVNTAIELDIFEILSKSSTPLSARDVATRVDADPQGIEVLLQMLESLGYVRGLANGTVAREMKYHNTPMTSKWLVKSSQTSLANYIRMWAALSFSFWDRYLKASIVSGKPPLTIYEWFSQQQQPERWNLFEDAMKELARITADEIVDKIKIPIKKSCRVLDLGGGHGLYSIKFCRANPQLLATIFDLPSAIESARKNIVAASLSSIEDEEEDIGTRITFQPGDFLKEDCNIGNGYDIVFLFNILHAHNADTNAGLLQKVSKAVIDGGKIVILEVTIDSSSSSSQNNGLHLQARKSKTVTTISRFFDIAFFVSLGGLTYSYEEIHSWLRNAGFEEIKRTGLKISPSVSLITAAKSRAP